MSDTPDPLAPLLSQPLVQVGRQSFTWPELLAWAELLGVLQPFWRELAHGQVLVQAAATRGEVLPQEQVQEAANAWRYERGLITAEETQQWLTLRGLDLDALFNYLSRCLWRHKATDDTPPASWPPAPPADELNRLLWHEAQFSGRFRHLALPGLWRALVVGFILHRGELNATVLQQAQEFLARNLGHEPDDLAHGRIPLAYAGETLEAMVRWEAYYQRHCEDIASTEDCRRRLPAMRPELIRLDLEHAVFHDENAAREARLCVSVDGESLAAVAQRAGAAWQRERLFSGDLPEPWREPLMSATVGVCFGPLAMSAEDSGPVRLWRVLRKEDPSLADPEVRQRVRERLITDTFAQYVNDDVHWLRFTPD